MSENNDSEELLPCANAFSCELWETLKGINSNYVKIMAVVDGNIEFSKNKFDLLDICCDVYDSVIAEHGSLNFPSKDDIDFNICALVHSVYYSRLLGFEQVFKNSMITCDVGILDKLDDEKKKLVLSNMYSIFGAYYGFYGIEIDEDDESLTYTPVFPEFEKNVSDVLKKNYTNYLTKMCKDIDVNGEDSVYRQDSVLDTLIFK